MNWKKVCSLKSLLNAEVTKIRGPVVPLTLAQPVLIYRSTRKYPAEEGSWDRTHLADSVWEEAERWMTEPQVRLGAILSLLLPFPMWGHSKPLNFSEFCPLWLKDSRVGEEKCDVATFPQRKDASSPPPTDLSLQQLLNSSLLRSHLDFQRTLFHASEKSNHNSMFA